MCVRCHTALAHRHVPRYSIASGFQLGIVPPCITQLNPMEARMVGLGVCFTTCYSLGHLGQSASRGNAINMWNDAVDVVSRLPRPSERCGVILVKLPGVNKVPKYYNVRPWLLRQVLTWLKANNPLYRDVTIDEDLLASMPEQPDLPDLPMDPMDTENLRHDANEEEGPIGVEESFILEDIGDHQLEDDKILELLSGSQIERAYPLPAAEHPINEYTTKLLMQSCFPTLFPTGRGGFHPIDGESRQDTFKLADYCSHLMAWHDRRFVAHPTFKFFCLNLIQRRQVDGLLQRLPVSSRANDTSQHIRGASASLSKCRDYKSRTKEYLKELKPYFRSVRGTGLYWANVRSDLMSLLGNPAMVNRWPTFFVTLSAADTIWPDFFRVCDPTLTLAEAAKLTPAQRRRYLNENPDLAAHHFHRRFLAFFNHILRGKTKPLGEIEDFFWRIEFQRRGSPHVHALLWVKDAPDILELSKSADGKEVLCKFADRFVSCLARFQKESMATHVPVDPLCVRAPPSTDTLERERDLGEVVKRVQQHVCSTRSSCYRDGGCRFGYPKALQSRTEVVREETGGKITIKFVHERDNEATNNYNPTMLSTWRGNMDIKIIGNAYGAAEYTAAYVSKAEPDSVRFHRTIEQALRKLPDGAPHSTTLKRTATALLGAREVSAQEAIYILSSTLCLYGKSRTIVKVKVTRHKRRYYRIANAETTCPSTSDRIRIEPIEHAYMQRPETPEFTDLTYREFCESFELSDTPPGPKQRLMRWPLLDGSGFIKAISHKQVVRPSPYLKADETDPDFCFAQLLLHRPWRTLQELPDDDAAVLDAYERWKQRDGCEWSMQIQEKIGRERVLAASSRNVIVLPSPQWSIGVGDQRNTDELTPMTAPDAFCSKYVYTMQDICRAKSFMKEVVQPFVAQGSHSSSKRNDSTYVYPTSEQRPAMTDDQWQPFAVWMMQNRRRALAQRSKQECPQIQMVVAGEGGTGKSWLIQHILNDVRVAFQAEPAATRVLLMAHQGSAAHAIGGRTITSALALPSQGCTFRKAYVPLASTEGGAATLRRLQNEYEGVHLIVIDEYGVISCGMLHWLNERLREIFAPYRMLPFGGRDVLFMGDTGQLGPVKASSLSTSEEQLFSDAEVRGRQLWAGIPHWFLLQQQNRGSADPEWYDILRRVRTGVATQADVDVINSRVGHFTARDQHDQVYLAYRNTDVDDANAEALKHLDSARLNIDAHHEIRVRTPADAVHLDDTTIRQLQLEARSLTSQATKHLPLTLSIAIGAPVILTYNMEQRAGLCNGSRGIIHDVIIDPESTTNQPIVLVKMSSYHGPSFVEGVAGVVPITSRTVALTVDKQSKYRFSRTALPLRLGFARTIHKIQGQTCAHVIFNPSCITSSALTYVALSRVKKRSDITLTKAVTEKQLQKIDRLKRIDDAEDVRLAPLMQQSREYASKFMGAMQTIASSHNLCARLRNSES